jgi:Asp-tRNA(Asn)/Glu-tRNA(Gln) amidotransferase A subunit family amidase
MVGKHFLKISLFGIRRRNRDTTGPITRTVADAARVLEAMVGYDPADNLTTLFLQVRVEPLLAAVNALNRPLSLYNHNLHKAF